MGNEHWPVLCLSLRLTSQPTWCNLLPNFSLAFRRYDRREAVNVNWRLHCIGKHSAVEAFVLSNTAISPGMVDMGSAITLLWQKRRWDTTFNDFHRLAKKLADKVQALYPSLPVRLHLLWSWGIVEVQIWSSWTLRRVHNVLHDWTDCNDWPCPTLEGEGREIPTPCRSIAIWQACWTRV